MHWVHISKLNFSISFILMLFTVISAVSTISLNLKIETEKDLIVQLTHFSLWLFILYQLVSMCTFTLVLKKRSSRKGYFKAMAKFIVALNSILISYLVHVLPLVAFAYWVYLPSTDKKVNTTFGNFYNHGISYLLIAGRQLIFDYHEPFLGAVWALLLAFLWISITAVAYRTGWYTGDIYGKFYTWQSPLKTWQTVGHAILVIVCIATAYQLIQCYMRKIQKAKMTVLNESELFPFYNIRKFRLCFL